MSNLLTAALHCASLSVTQGLVMHQRYARGVVVGLLACLTNQSGDFEFARTVVRDSLPKDADPAALPDNMSEFHVKQPEKPSKYAIDSVYWQLINAFLPRIIFDEEDIKAAKKALQIATAIPRHERSFAVHCYTDLVDELLRSHWDYQLVKFANGGAGGNVNQHVNAGAKNTDSCVLSYLMLMEDHDISTLSLKTGIAEYRLRTILAGENHLERQDIAALCELYSIPSTVFDHTPRVGMPRGRYKVISHFNGYELKDTHTGRTHWLGDGVDAVTDGIESVAPDSIGFIERWELDLNTDVCVEEAYFPNEEQPEESNGEEFDDSIGTR